MAKVSIAAKCRASTREGKEGSVYFQIRYDRVTRNLKSEYKILPHEWDSEAECIAVDDGASERAQQLRLINDMISCDIRRYHTLAKQMLAQERLNCCDDLIFECQRLGRGESFFSFAEREIATLEEDERRAQTAKNHTSSVSSFARFCAGTDVVLDNVTPSLIGGYEAHLKESNVTLSTISFYMRNLRSIYNKAVEQGLTEQQNPFEGVYTGVPKTERQALTIEEIRRIKEWDCSAKRRVAYARDMFLFSFYTQGMQFADIASLRKSDIEDGVLRYQRSQKGQMIYIAWERCMEEIVERYGVEGSEYLFPILRDMEGGGYHHEKVTNALVRVNRGLKRLSAEMGLPMALTFKVARNSWAMAAHNKRIPISVITQSLGFSDDHYTRRHLASIKNSANSLVLGDLLE